LTRLYFVVEGRTEESIVNRVLVPHLATRGVYAAASSLDGGSSWARWRRDLKNWLRAEPAPWFTTMFDLYAIPKDMPGRVAATVVPDANRRADAIEQAVLVDLGRDVPVIERRLIPHVQVHEVEALVLAGLDRLAALMPERSDAVEALASAVGATPPEEINDRPEWAPSKRLSRVPGYDKVLHGPLVVEDVGVDALRLRCPRFGAWLARLEALGASGSGQVR
jgi:hypothetical protein